MEKIDKAFHYTITGLFLFTLFQTETAVKIWQHYLLSSQISLTYVMVKDSYLMSAIQERTVLETVLPSTAANAKGLRRGC